MNQVHWEGNAAKEHGKLERKYSTKDGGEMKGQDNEGGTNNRVSPSCFPYKLLSGQAKGDTLWMKDPGA